ncbi:hypothetical protein JCM18918_2963 [Cutibacterium acnes JCM 18918]|nr:hypothetical protein JCM18918_2963 [Cutibacterium acnes JCM 18918]
MSVSLWAVSWEFFDLGHGSLSSMRTTGWGLAGRCAPAGTPSTLEPVAKNVGAVSHS